MTRDEFAAYLKDAIDPTKAPEALTKIREGVEELYTTNETARKQAETDKATIAELQGVNMRMFLRGGVDAGSHEEEHEETLDEYKARMAKKIRGEE